MAVRWRGRAARLVLIALSVREEAGGYRRVPPPVRVYLRHPPPAVAQVVCQEDRAMAVEAALTELVRAGRTAGEHLEWRSQPVRTARRPGWADEATVAIIIHRLIMHGR
eukprot:2149818-Alexandrium_andersonii.AAC.1